MGIEHRDWESIGEVRRLVVIRGKGRKSGSETENEEIDGKSRVRESRRGKEGGEWKFAVKYFGREI